MVRRSNSNQPKTSIYNLHIISIWIIVIPVIPFVDEIMKEKLYWARTQTTAM